MGQKNFDNLFQKCASRRSTADVGDMQRQANTATRKSPALRLRGFSRCPQTLARRTVAAYVGGTLPAATLLSWRSISAP